MACLNTKIGFWRGVPQPEPFRWAVSCSWPWGSWMIVELFLLRSSWWCRVWPRLWPSSGAETVLEFAGLVSRWWFVALDWAVTNAINFIDNMDGLAGLDCAARRLRAAWSNGSWQRGDLGGGLLGFLRWNVAPAKVFMGDGGSLPTGLLAVIAARTHGGTPPKKQVLRPDWLGSWSHWARW